MKFTSCVPAVSVNSTVLHFSIPSVVHPTVDVFFSEGTKEFDTKEFEGLGKGVGSRKDRDNTISFQFTYARVSYRNRAMLLVGSREQASLSAATDP